MNTINYDVYKNIVTKHDGFNPVSSEKNYTKLKFKFKKGDGWENCSVITASFFISNDNIVKSEAEFLADDMTAVFDIPEEFSGVKGKINVGLQGTYGNTTIATNIITINRNNGIIVTDNAPQNLYEQLIAKLTDYLKQIDDEFVEKVNVSLAEYLTEHPELVTVIKDGTVTENKLETKLLSKLSYVTPQMFGAKGDDVNDDTQAIQEAIDSGKAVYIPTGTYKINKLVILNTCKIYGDGIDKTVLKINYFQDENDSALYGLEIGNSSISADNCVLRDFTIVGRKNDTEINDSKKYGGIRLYKTAGSTFENIKITSTGRHGIQVTMYATDCKFSNITCSFNKNCGFSQQGFGNCIVNSQCSQNESDGMLINTGGFQASNVKCWGNRGNGFNISGTNALIVQLSNCEAQQNGKDGLHMENGCSGCVVTGYQGLANNYISSSRIDDNPVNNGCGITIGGHNNYIQGSIVSGYENGDWNAIEATSVIIEEADTYENIVDVFVTDTRKLTDRYNLYFNEKYPKYNFCENKLIRLLSDNPFNSVKINGSEMIDKSMTDIAKISEYNSGITVSESTTDGVLSLQFSDYDALEVLTLDDLTYSYSSKKLIDGTDGKNVVVPYLRKYYSLVNDNDTQPKSLYIKLTAKTSKFRTLGLFVYVQIEKESGEYEYIFRDADKVKNTCVFGTEFVDRYIYVDLSGVDGNIKAICPRLAVTKLTDDCDTTTSIDIKEFSYKLSYGECTEIEKQTSGTDGKSAYEIAVENGFSGTETEWLASLKGTKGDTGNGIKSTVLNDDYTLTINFTNGTSLITSSIRGENGSDYVLTDDDKTGIANIAIGNITDGDEVKY